MLLSGEPHCRSCCSEQVTWWREKMVSRSWVRAGCAVWGQLGGTAGIRVQGCCILLEGPVLLQAPAYVIADCGSRCGSRLWLPQSVEEQKLVCPLAGLGLSCPKPSPLRRLRALPKPVCPVSFITTWDTSCIWEVSCTQWLR